MKALSSKFSLTVPLLCAAAVLFTFAVSFFLPTVLFRHALESVSRQNLLSDVDVLSADITQSFGGDLENEDLSFFTGSLVDRKKYRILITDDSGVVTFDNSLDYNRKGSVLLTAECISALGGTEVFSSESLSGHFYFSAYVPVYSPSGEISGSLMLLDINDEAYNTFRSFRTALLYVALSLSFLLILTALYILNRYRRSFTAVIKGVQILTSGNFAYRFSLNGGDYASRIAFKLNDLASSIAATEEMRRRFVSDASHELKTPLASIKLLSDSIIQTPDMKYEEIREFLIDISNEIDRLTRISSRLLQLTKLDDVNAVARREDINLKVVAVNVCRMLKPLADDSNCKIRTELADNCVVNANYDTLYQIFYNLLENSIKYSGRDKEVRVFIYERDNLGVFIVDDDGEGIPTEDLQRIFDRFYRVDKARARATGGTGLGLSIVAAAVKSCGGTVTAENRVSGGARFTVRFPLCVTPEHGEEDSIYD